MEYTCKFDMDGKRNWAGCPNLRECNENGNSKSDKNKILCITNSLKNEPLKFKEELTKFLEDINENTYVHSFHINGDTSIMKCFYKESNSELRKYH